jgi:hypothetical protein
LGDFVDDFWSLIPLTPSWSRNTVDTVDRMLTAYQQGDVIDAFNVVNPLLPVANIALAMDNDDWYTVGQATIGVGVAILSIVVAKKLPGVGKGAKTTRGPPTGAPKHRRAPSATTKRQATVAATDTDGVTRCQYCSTATTDKAGLPNSKEYDHRIPYVRNGASDGDNIKVACRTCNRSKGAKTPEEWGGPKKEY